MALPRPSLSSLADSSRKHSADGVADHPELFGDRPLQAPFVVEDEMCLGSVSHVAHRSFSGQLTRESNKHRADRRNTRFAADGRRSDLVFSRETGFCVKTRTSMGLLREAGKLRVSGLVGWTGF